MSVEGIRVVRGPDWSYGEDDGGEGHVGTVTQDNEDDTVEVQWDMGNSGTYNTGNDGKCDLRILDSAPAGLKHEGVYCDSCSGQNFPGTRWKCRSCPDFDLCSPCYFRDAHDTHHQFARIDAPGLNGEAVPKRSISVKLRALGMFKGAKVTRGVDWNYGNQDGGDGQVGHITETRSYGTTGPMRDSVKVKWPGKEDNSYRLGYRGKVDLVCTEETPGMDFYRDHLFVMNTQHVPKTSLVPSFKRVSVRMGGGERKSIGSQRPQVGDKVCVNLPEVALKEVQRGHGGWSMRMKEYIGQHGELKRVEENGDFVIQYDDKEYRFNSEAVCTIPKLKLGDIVRIIPDSDKVQALQKRHGGWQTEMQATLGKVGKIVKIDSDGDVAVAFGNKAWVFNPACCVPAPGEKVAELGGGEGTEEVRRQESGFGAGRRPGAGAGSAGDSGSGEEEVELEDAAGALGNLIAGLLLMRGLKSVAGPQHLVAAAANNDAETVQAVLKQNPRLINAKHQGLTALIIASHEGNKAIVRILLAAGADKDLREEKGNTALMAALMKKREEVAEILIEAGADINLWNRAGRTALHFAASNGCSGTLRTLLQKGADPNRQDIAGDTPLHDAIENKHDLCAAFLIAHDGINLRICNRKGHSPLHLAAMKDDEITVSRIISKAPELKNSAKGDSYTPLHVAAVNDNTDVVKTLIKANVDVDKMTGKRYTALHLACHQGYINTAKLLVEASAKVNLQDEDGDTALHNAVMGSRGMGEGEALARLLGISVSNEGELKDRTNLACFLIQNGADLSIRNRKGRTALESCRDERMRNAIRMFAEKHGKTSGGASGSGARQQAAGRLLADLFSELPLPCMGCMEKMADCKFAPCGHRVCCQRCSFRVRDCPMCDTPILERFDLAGRRLVLDPCKVQ